MHLLVLSAFRPGPQIKLADQPDKSLNAPFGAQCFPTTSRKAGGHWTTMSQCTFWCSVLSDDMSGRAWSIGRPASLNAPFGAQCFPTCRAPVPQAVRTERLNAPFGAQCFPTASLRRRPLSMPTSQCTFWCSVLSDYLFLTANIAALKVSMHLLVLSAFRLVGRSLR